MKKENNNWTIQNEINYRVWRNSLPINLKNTNDNDYDMRAAYKAGMQPMWNDTDKSYHLGSRDPKTGRILKSPHHPTFLKALVTDASLGYYPIMDRNGNVYTETWKGNTYASGGYIPSDSIKKRIANWEGSSMKTNRSFADEARDFNYYLPKGAKDKLSQQQLDALYSYSYNVGAGNFNKRVVPVLTDYLKGRASKEDVQKSMYATRDKELRGLTLRRNEERKMFGGDYQSIFTGQKNSSQLGYIDRNQQYRNMIDSQIEQNRQKNILFYGEDNQNEEDNQTTFKNLFDESNINVNNILGNNAENNMSYAQIPTSKLDVTTILQSANTPINNNMGQSILPNYSQMYLNEFDSNLLNS